MATRADRYRGGRYPDISKAQDVADEEEDLQPVRRFVVCLVQPNDWKDESTYGVVDATQVAAGYTSHAHLRRSQIVAEIKAGVEYWTASIVRDKKGSATVVVGARVHPVHDSEHDRDWITTNPNDTARDNLGSLRWCDQVIEEA